MHLTWSWSVILYFVVTAAVIIGTLIDMYLQRAKEQRARIRWETSKQTLNGWLREGEFRSIESPEGQTLLNLEVYAYTEYLHSKNYIEESEHRYMRERLDLMLRKTTYRSPYS